MVEKISVKEKIGFGLGDTAMNFVYASVTLLLAYFYTDVYGLEPTVVAGIFLLVRILDAVTDPIMGLIADRHKSKWGKYRPFLIYLSVPYALASVAVFVVPPFSEEMKIIYAYASYGLLMVLFTAINIPYFALGSVITADPTERMSLNTYRFVAAGLGGLFVTLCALPLVELLSGGEAQQVGYPRAMALMAVLSILLFLICFRATKERVAPPPKGNVNIASDVFRVIANDQWRLLAFAIFMLVTGSTFKGTVQIFYISHYVGSSEGLISLFLSTFVIGGIIGVALSKIVTTQLDKKIAWVCLFAFSSITSIITYFVAEDQLVTIFVLQFLYGFFVQMMGPIVFSTMADVIDYGELKDGRRLDGLVSSFTIFFLKLGLAVGGAAATYILGLYGYKGGGGTQSLEAIQGILITFTIIPVFAFVAGACALFFMRLNKQTVQANADTLADIRSGNTPRQSKE